MSFQALAPAFHSRKLQSIKESDIILDMYLITETENISQTDLADDLRRCAASEWSLVSLRHAIAIPRFKKPPESYQAV